MQLHCLVTLSSAMFLAGKMCSFRPLLCIVVVRLFCSAEWFFGAKFHLTVLRRNTCCRCLPFSEGLLWLSRVILQLVFAVAWSFHVSSTSLLALVRTVVLSVLICIALLVLGGVLSAVMHCAWTSRMHLCTGLCRLCCGVFAPAIHRACWFTQLLL